MNLYEFTGLGRPLDPAHRSNRLAMSVTSLSGISAAFLSWLFDGSPDVIGSGVVALGVFLAWAIAREIDPDRPGSATAAMLIAWPVALLAPPALLAAGVVLLGVRIMAGTVGGSLTTTDYLILIGASALAASEPVAWPAIGVLTYAVWKESSSPTWPLWAMPGGAVIVALGSGALPQPGIPGVGAGLLLAGVIVVGFARRQTTMVVSMCDTGDRAIEAGAVSRARLAAIVAIVGGAILSPIDVLALGPSIASILALALPDSRPGQSSQNDDTRSVDLAGPEFLEPHPLAAGTIPPVL